MRSMSQQVRRAFSAENRKILLGRSLWFALALASLLTVGTYLVWEQVRLSQGEPSVVDKVALVIGIVVMLFFCGAIYAANVAWIKRRKSDERYRQLFENNPAGVYRSDVKGRLLDCNTAFVTLFGYAGREEILIESTKDFYGDLAERSHLLTSLLQDGRAQTETLFRRKDGSTFWGVLSARTLASPGESPMFEGTVIDVTRRKRIEDELQRSEDALQEFSKIALDHEQDFQIRLGRLLSVGCHFFACETGAFWKLEGETLRIESQAGGGLVPAGTVFALAETYAGEVVRRGELAGFACAAESWREGEASVRPFPLEAYVGLPVFVSGGIAGILDFGSRMPREAPFGPTYREFLQIIGLWLGGELERQQRDEESRRLSFLMEYLPSCNTMQEAFHFFASQWDEFFPKSTGAVYLDLEGDDLRAAYRWGEGAGELDERLPRHDCWAFRFNRQSLSAQEAVPCIHLAGAASFEHFCLPMLARGKTWGVLHLRFDREVPAPGRSSAALRESRRRLAAAVAENLAMSLANLDLREKLKIQAERDPVTQLFNREYFNRWLEGSLIDVPAARDGRSGLIMLDLDNFGRFNKEVSHMAGDHVLGELGDLLRREIRGGDIACKYGGEEFVVILDGASLEVTRKRAEKLREGFKSLQLSYQGRILGPLTLSAGVAALPDHGDSRQSVLAAADAALRHAKEAGRDQVAVAPLGD